MSETFAARYRSVLVHLSCYFALVVVAIVALATYFSEGHELRWVAAGLLAVFAGSVAWERWSIGRLWRNPHAYITLQTGLVLILLLIPPQLGFFVFAYFALSGLVMVQVSPRTGFLWLGIFALATAGALIYADGWRESLPMVILSGAGYLFFGSFAAVTVEAVRARQELLEALRQLQDYAAQAEQLVVVEERNRLARELHDSVTQTLFSMTMTAEAARIVSEQNSAQVAPHIVRLKELAQSALNEMRSVISQLHPVTDEGLVQALRKHLATLKSQEGLTVELRVEGDPQLSREQEEGMFRIVQEALNNVSKHARTDEAVVTLQMETGAVSLLIEDHGVGFDPYRIEPDGRSMGLRSMRERAEIQGGSLNVESSPGQGTCIRVTVPSIIEVKTHG